MPAKGSKLRYGNREYVFKMPFYKKRIVEEKKVNRSFEECKRIIDTTNKNIADVIVEELDGFKLPFGLGYICAGKYIPTYPMIDWKKSNEAGKHIYHTNLHTNGYAVKAYWFRVGRISNTKFHEIYKFAPYKTLSNAISRMFGSGKKSYTDWSVSDFIEKSRLENLYNKKYRKELLKQ